jgi:predicted enzyme related to lactoylglutathione lyase
MAQVKGIDTHGYMVKDMKRAKAFYMDALGMKPSMELGDDFIEFDLGDGSNFGLWNPKAVGWEWERGHGIMFAVDDAVATVKELREKYGIEIEDAKEHAPCFMAMGTDTEGNQLIIHQRKNV